MRVYDMMEIPANWGTLDVHDKMAHIAEIETHAPYDLIRDVWDVADNSHISRETFEMLLNQVIESFLTYESYKEYLDERHARY